MADPVALTVEFCGELHEVDPGRPFSIGRGGDLSVDDNPYLHRVFLVVTWDQRLWWLANVGSRLSATVSDRMGGLDAWLSPGGSVPIVVPETVVRFTAGSTTYEVGLSAVGAPLPFASVDVADLRSTDDATIGPPSLTLNQRLVVLALVEPALRGSGDRPHEVPASSAAAQRIGVPVTTFNRRLDNICEKLDAAGVRGLKGDVGGLASNRRARLAEFALSSRLVDVGDLDLLDRLEGVS